jgi:hypothetical protein
MERAYSDVVRDSISHRVNNYLREVLEVFKVEEGTKPVREKNTTLPTKTED